MTRSEFRQLLQKWCIEDADGSRGIEDLKRDVEFLESELYHEYSVTAHGPHGSFGYRLARWIANVTSEDDQRILYSILRHLFFIGTKEQEAAYRTAFSKHVLQWLISVHNIDAFAVDAMHRVEEQLRQTRYTEVTDSFGIRSFCLLNGIQGENIRYRWEGNVEDWDAGSFRSNVLRQNVQGEVAKINLVLFEDFVGSGSQMAEAVKLACSLGPDVNVLLCPLYICPVGARYAHYLANKLGNLTFSPVLAFEKRFFLLPSASADEPADFGRIRELLLRVHHMIAGPQQEFGPFGYRKTGGLIVPASNCPDNTIPAIHRQKENSWEPLFLRTARIWE